MSKSKYSKGRIEYHKIEDEMSGWQKESSMYMEDSLSIWNKIALDIRCLNHDSWNSGLDDGIVVSK